MDNRTTPLERTATDLRDYTQLQLRRLKLRVIDRSATALNSVFWALMAVVLCSFTLFFGAAAGVWALSLWTGSMLWALLMVTGGFLLVTIIVWMCRKRLIVNAAIKMLGRLFFDNEGSATRKEEEEDYE